MSAKASPFNRQAVKHPRNFTVIEPKDAYTPKESWWIQPTRDDFIARRDAELSRMLHARSINPTAESGNTARQTFVNRMRTHSVMGWLPKREGAE